MELKHVPRVSSALKAVDLVQIPPPLIIGERLNTQGSKKAKRLVLSDDFDGLIELGREQVRDGAHCIDVCVATTERSDELEFMKKLVKRLSLEIDAPLVIDSTDPKVISEAVYHIPGRPIINSINLEEMAYDSIPLRQSWQNLEYHQFQCASGQKEWPRRQKIK
jgi:5-methyltetrahydrofolate--homocysteine methyltransferase